jgi:hypothetical protein
MFDVRNETVINNDDGFLRIQWVNNLPFIHLHLYVWTPSKYKEYKRIWNKFLSDLAKKDVPCVFVIIPDDDEKLYKFETMFGFEEAEHGNGYFLMVKDTE